jgi:hypothetical protein
VIRMRMRMVMSQRKKEREQLVMMRWFFCTDLLRVFNRRHVCMYLEVVRIWFKLLSEGEARCTNGLKCPWGLFRGQQGRLVFTAEPPQKWPCMNRKNECPLCQANTRRHLPVVTRVNIQTTWNIQIRQYFVLNVQLANTETSQLFETNSRWYLHCRVSPLTNPSRNPGAWFTKHS